MNAAAWFWTALSAVIAGGSFSALFHALSDLSRPALERLAAERPNEFLEGHLKKVLNDLHGHAHAIALLRIACNATAAVAATLAMHGLRSGDAPAPVGWTEIGLGVPLAALVVWTFGLIVPASVARHAGEQAVYTFAPLIRLVYGATYPIQAVARFFDEVVRRLSGQTAQTQAEEAKEEILSVVEEARHEGQFDESEQNMIEAVVQFRDTTVGQIMTPRTEIEAFELTNDLGKVIAQVRKGGKSRIPVYEDSIDKIVGVFYVKDLMRWLAGEGAGGGRASGRPFSLKAILRPAIFVPETKTVRELLQELLAKRVHIAIVADEFGGTAGLVTFEDIAEQVFGDIQDEYEIPEPPAEEVKVGDGAAEVEGRAYIADANEQLKVLGIQLPEGEDYDTVGGLVTVAMGRIPSAGERAVVAGIDIEIVEAEPTRVTRVKLSKPAPPPADAPDQPRETPVPAE